MLLLFSELLYMVIGGEEVIAGEYIISNAVELVSLDPDNNPVPPCLADLNNFPIGIEAAAGFIGEGTVQMYRTI